MTCFSSQIFHIYHADGHYWSLPFDTTFTGFDLDVGSQIQQKPKPVCFIISHACQDENWCDVEAIQVEQPDSTLEWDLYNWGK